jgi:hypothetical protein
MSAYALPDLFHAPTPCFSFTEEKRDDGDEDAVGIAITEAKVDSALLIQSLVGGLPKESSQKSAHFKSRRRRPASSSAVSPALSSEDALKFELSISFNGRKYTAMRSLPSFEQLRQDLLEEVEADIPELCFEESVKGGSFSCLQGIIQSYIPRVERWLRHVTRHVSLSQSPSLRSFLWEPAEPMEYLHRDTSCSSHLDAIVESDTENEGIEI